jgi:Kelch motif
MNVARVGHRAALLGNGLVLVAGGWNPSNGYLSTAELYNPASGKWTFTGSLSIARYNHNAVLLQNGQVLVAGGTDPNACCGATAALSSAELYNPATGTWTATGSMTTGRESFIMALLSNGEVLAAGGDDGNGAMNTAEIYNPATGTWTATTSMPPTYAEGPLSVTIQSG